MGRRPAPTPTGLEAAAARRAPVPIEAAPVEVRTWLEGLSPAQLRSLADAETARRAEVALSAVADDLIGGPPLGDPSSLVPSESGTANADFVASLVADAEDERGPRRLVSHRGA
jgi:hypothetical protein